MTDQAVQEAIKRARQIAQASKLAQSVPVKRPASELDDHSVGTVKVTLAYEKPPGSDRDSKRDNRRSSSSHRESYNREPSGHHSSRDKTSDRDRSSERERSKDRDTFSGNGNGPYAGRNGGGSSNSHQPGYNSMLSGNYGSNHSGGMTDGKIEIIIPHAVIGLVIGKGGENIKRIQNETGATVRVDPNSVDEKGNKICTITGTKQAVDEAHKQVESVIENAATGRRPRTQTDGGDQYKMRIPASRTGAIIGKGGETIKSIKQQSGCDIELDKGSKECGPDESLFIIRGSQEKIQKAKSLIEARLAVRGRDADNSSRSSSKGFATGANAAPIAPVTDLPSNYPAAAAGQQNSADIQAAWGAYFAQQYNIFGQAGVQPATTNLPYSGSSLLNPTATTSTASSVPQLDTHSIQQSQHQPQTQSQSQSQPQSHSQPPQTTVAGQQDYSDQWIEFYLMNGRPDYAEQIIEMKKQQQKQQQSSQPK